MLVKNEFAESIRVKEKALECLVDVVETTGQALIDTFHQGGKVYICGNGGSAADAQHFAAELINRFEKERCPLPAVALTTDSSNLTSIANDYSYEVVFSKQLEALGDEKDTLVAISTSGNSVSINNAIEVAIEKGMRVILLTGEDGGKSNGFDYDSLMRVKVPSKRTARIQEVHMLIIHTWCVLVDNEFA